jgi:hypothetical protein
MSLKDGVRQGFCLFDTYFDDTTRKRQNELSKYMFFM